MAEGFIFNHNRCVACGACTAACTLENGWPFRPRTIYTYNSVALPGLPLINLSLACNHCKKAVCMEGCPSSSFYRDQATGAVLFDENRCTGCRYCQWNCPYDAPKYIISKGIIGKCNLCFQRMSEGLMPACSTACPTGALDYGEQDSCGACTGFSWFPEKNLEPAIKFTGQDKLPLKVVPENAFVSEMPQSAEHETLRDGDWSLIAFSFLTTLSVADIISGLIGGVFPDKIQTLSIIIAAGILSLFHLGKKGRAWRAVFNFSHSPLSREIAFFILFALLAGVTLILELPSLLIFSSLAGLLLLVSIDAVYINADNRRSVFLHSGQTFITALLLVSFMTGKILPFLFIVIIKLAASVYHFTENRDYSSEFVMRFARSALLILVALSMISGISYGDTAVFCLLLGGELLDRIIFYIDFKPPNINRLINRLHT